MISAFLFSAILSPRLDDLLDSSPELTGASYGVMITTTRGEVLYERNADRRLVPASNQKILSALYALQGLGPGYRPQTRISEHANGVFVDSPGDPALTPDRLREVGKKLFSRARPVYIRQNYAPGVPPTWENDDLPNRYAAPVYAFTIDQGAFRVTTTNGVINPLPSELGISLVRGTLNGPLRVRYDMAKAKVTVDGDLGTDSKTLDTLALPRPSVSAGRFLGLQPKLEPGSPGQELQAFVVNGDPLSKMVADCLQPSDNQYAEHLLLMTAASKGKISNPFDPYGAARADFRQFLVQTIGLNEQDVRPMDGSGLSRQNLVTVRGLSQALRWATTQPWFSVFDQGLASPGTGTLRSRLAGSSFRGKTGTLNSVVGLSGYLTRPDGERWIVSIIINNTLDSTAKVRDLADSIVRTTEQVSPVGPNLVYSSRHDLGTLR